MKHKYLLALSAAFLSACGSMGLMPSDSPASSGPSASEIEKCSLSPLTGECFDPENPVLLVKIDDVIAARPQLNLNDADVVVVEPVESGLTRLMVVYNSVLPVKVGPVRSARITDIDIAAAFGRPGFAYSGSTSKLVPYLTSANLQLVGAPQGATGYTRDSTRYAPHDLVATTSDLIARFSDINSAKLEIGQTWKFGKLLAPGKKPVSVEAIWPSSSKSFEWNQAISKWLISADGTATNSLIDTGVLERATATTVFIQQAELLPSPFVFSNGVVTPYAQTTGSGVGWVLTQGQSFYGRWERPEITDLPRWFDKDGNEIAIQPGNIWWLIVDRVGSRVEIELVKPTKSPMPSASKAK
jgi:hypothetical protein